MDNSAQTSNLSSKARNQSIDLFRMVCAAMVIAIHCHPLVEFGELPAYAVRFVIPGIVVPFFFAVSGYYFIGARLKGKKVYL